MWVGRVEGGVNGLIGGRMKFVDYRVGNWGLGDNRVWVVGGDKGNEVWIGRWGRGFGVMNVSEGEKIIGVVIDGKDEDLVKFGGGLG